MARPPLLLANCKPIYLSGSLKKIKGHCARAMYLMTGVEGLANIIKNSSLNDGVDRLGGNMIDTKFYIHGGIGAMHDYKGFFHDYELPPNCYAETCASLGILFLGKQLLNRKLHEEIPQVRNVPCIMMQSVESLWMVRASITISH